MTDSFLSGRTIGTYRLVAGLGQGGMARVYLALSDKRAGFQKLFVLKVLRGDIAADPEFVAMFLEEARVTARLNHPNVVHTYEVGEHQGRYFIAMEYLEGQSLSSIAARIGREKIPLPLHLRFLSDTLAGLHYAHELDDYDGQPLRIVHRDVSPQNVFVTYAGQAKILDFGIAKAAGGISATRQGVVKGKVGYMAPEQATGHPVDRRSDIYAVGIMLWEAIAGRRLVTRDEPESLVLERRVAGQDPPIAEIVPDVPTDLAAICDKAMRSNPDERYLTAAEMRRDLEQHLHRLGPSDSSAVASLLEEHFADDRREMRRLVEEQVKGVDSDRQSARQPLMVLGTDENLSTPTLDDLPVTAVLSETKPRARPGRWWWAALGVGVAVALLGIVFARGRRWSEGPAGISSSTTMAHSSATSSNSSAPTSPPPSASAAPLTRVETVSAEAQTTTATHSASPPDRRVPPPRSTVAAPRASTPSAEPSAAVRVAPAQPPPPKRTVDETNPY